MKHGKLVANRFGKSRYGFFLLISRTLEISRKRKDFYTYCKAWKVLAEYFS